MKTVYVRIAIAMAATASTFYRAGIKHTKAWQKLEVDPATLNAFEAEQMLEVAYTQPADFDENATKKSDEPPAGIVGVDDADLLAAQAENELGRAALEAVKEKNGALAAEAEKTQAELDAAQLKIAALEAQLAQATSPDQTTTLADNDAAATTATDPAAEKTAEQVDTSQADATKTATKTVAKKA